MYYEISLHALKYEVTNENANKRIDCTSGEVESYREQVEVEASAQL